MTKPMPPITDHVYFRQLREQCLSMKPMDQIAAELDVDVNEMLRWIMAYKAPHKPKEYLNRNSVAADAKKPTSDRWSMPAQAQRFASWRKATQGAAAARRRDNDAR